MDETMLADVGESEGPDEPQHSAAPYSPMGQTDSGPNWRRLIPQWTSWLIVAACSIFVFFTLNPNLILANTTVTGGDMGAHVWGPRFLLDHLIPEFRITGWTQDWYAGFPAYVFYMVVPSLIVAWLTVGPPIWLSPILVLAIGVAAYRLSRAIKVPWQRHLMWAVYVFLGVLCVPVPYNIAFKLVTVSGLVTLPVAAYVLARSAKAPFPVPAMVSVSTLPFIYDKGFTILGGNGASTMAGEFAFSISLTFALLYLAVLFRGIRTRRDRALGALLVGLTILCHLIPAIFALIVTVGVVLFLRREDRVPWWDANRTGRIVAAVAVVILTLSMASKSDFVLIRGFRTLPGASFWFPRQWWFPALGSIVAIALFTNFEPRIPDWLRVRRNSMLVGAAAVVTVALMVLAWSWWALALGLIALVLLLFAGVDERVFRWGIWVGPVGGLLSAFWTLPMIANSAFMNDMGWEKYTRYYDYLLAVPQLDSGGMPFRDVVFGLAGLGLVLAVLNRVRLGWFLGLTVVVLAWIFRFFPQYRLWNARLLPFYYLALYLAAGLAIGMIARMAAIAVSEIRRRTSESYVTGAVAAVLGMLLVMTVMLGTFGLLPGGQVMADPANSQQTIYRWPENSSVKLDFPKAIVNDWARWNYSGLEGKPAYPEYKGVISMMKSVADANGCGRAMWEYEPDLNRYGTTMALMLLPYFTNGCVASMEGLYFESSSTTPFHFLMQSELSSQPSRAQREMPYGNFDIDLGVEHLQLLGVRYYMATSDQAIAAADSDPRLTEVADKTFSYVDIDNKASHRWVVYKVADSPLVEGLRNDPVVLKNADDHIDGWVYSKERLEPTESQKLAGAPGSKTAGPATEWFLDPSRWDVFLASSGPGNWPRGNADEAIDLRSSNADVKVSQVSMTSDSISFDVDRIGVPVLVKVSYFPNWRATGADGPYRVSPNFMVVVPTSKHVRLHYGYSAYEVLGMVATLGGVAAVFALAIWDERRRVAALAHEVSVERDVDAADEALPPTDP